MSLLAQNLAIMTCIKWLNLHERRHTVGFQKFEINEGNSENNFLLARVHRRVYERQKYNGTLKIRCNFFFYISCKWVISNAPLKASKSTPGIKTGSTCKRSVERLVWKDYYLQRCSQASFSSKWPYTFAQVSVCPTFDDTLHWIRDTISAPFVETSHRPMKFHAAVMDFCSWWKINNLMLSFVSNNLSNWNLKPQILNRFRSSYTHFLAL